MDQKTNDGYFRAQKDHLHLLEGVPIIFEPTPPHSCRLHTIHGFHHNGVCVCDCVRLHSRLCVRVCARVCVTFFFAAVSTRYITEAVI